MEEETILITGANGEIGHSLIQRLVNEWETNRDSKLIIIAFDIKSLDPKLENLCRNANAELIEIKGDVRKYQEMMGQLADYKISTVYHLASLLSTKAEKQPLLAHSVNVQGTFNLLRIINENAKKYHNRIRFMFPSSIAVYGLPKGKEKVEVTEEKFNDPITIYGAHKLFCEALGELFNKSFNIDFRALRFPGLISADTVPGDDAGTSDFVPQMWHYTADPDRKNYKCFVKANTCIAFMAMSDGVDALLKLCNADEALLNQRRVYNVQGFSLSALNSKKSVVEQYGKKNTNITFRSVKNRQRIVDSWPADCNDSAARNDWDWKPEYNSANAFFEKELIPALNKEYP